LICNVAGEPACSVADTSRFRAEFTKIAAVKAGEDEDAYLHQTKSTNAIKAREKMRVRLIDDDITDSPEIQV
jgi:hypothetical protein